MSYSCTKHGWMHAYNPCPICEAPLRFVHDSASIDGYVHWMAKAQELTDKKIKQKQCPKCGLWLFPDEI